MHRATLDNHDTRCRCVCPYSHRIAAHLTLRAAFLNLHRQYFAQAINEGLWTNHKYALSVAAVYEASRSLLWNLEAYYRQQPEYSVRSQRLWWNGLSSAVSLFSGDSGRSSQPFSDRVITAGDTSSTIGYGVERVAGACQGFPVLLGR